MNSTVESPKSSQVKSAKLELERLQSQVNVLKLQLATQRQELNQVEAGSDRFLAIASQLSEIHAAINNLQPSIQRAMTPASAKRNRSESGWLRRNAKRGRRSWPRKSNFWMS